MLQAVTSLVFSLTLKPDWNAKVTDLAKWRTNCCRYEVAEYAATPYKRDRHAGIVVSAHRRRHLITKERLGQTEL
jgi:hypothetical protein